MSSLHRSNECAEVLRMCFIKEADRVLDRPVHLDAFHEDPPCVLAPSEGCSFTVLLVVVFKTAMVTYFIVL